MVKWLDCVTCDPKLPYVHVAGASVNSPNRVFTYLSEDAKGETNEVYHPYDKCIISRDLSKW